MRGENKMAAGVPGCEGTDSLAAGVADGGAARCGAGAGAGAGTEITCADMHGRVV